MKNRFLCTLVATLAIFNAFGSSPETAQPSTTATHATSSHSKIISLAPGITEALCMLGLGNMLVGRTFACDFPTAIQSVPIVMEADGKLDLKAVEKIKPDFIIMPSSLVDSPLHEELSKRRISHIGIKYSSLQDFCQSIFEVATRFDAADAATEWMSELERTINACQDRVQKSLVKARKNNAELKTPSIMIILGRRANGELIVAGRKSYHQSLIELLGMRNASDDNAFLSLKNEESLKESDPDIIL